MSLEAGLLIHQCIIKLACLDILYLPLHNNSDNGLGTHLTCRLSCNLCPAHVAGRAAVRESCEVLQIALSSIPALLYFGATMYL